MRRLHLVELEDCAWVPAPVRDAAIAILDVGAERMAFYDGTLPALTAVLEQSSATALVDLCSGEGGPALRMRTLLRRTDHTVSLTLSDLHPSRTGGDRVAALADAEVRYHDGPVDAMAGGPAGAGVRTMFGALHHFRPDDVSRLIAGVVSRRQPLCFVDVAASPAVRRLPVVAAVPAILLNAAMLVLVALTLMPLVRPVRASYLALTYLLPIVPLLFAWDGTVSALRAYTAEEVLAIAKTVPGAEGYSWAAGRSGRALYLTGVPRPADAAS
jgi:hypothetical protein